MKKIILTLLLIYPLLVYPQSIKEITKYDVPKDSTFRGFSKTDLIDNQNLLIVGRYHSPNDSKAYSIAHLINLPSLQITDFVIFDKNEKDKWKPLLAKYGDDGFRYGIYQKDFVNYIIKANENGEILKILPLEEIISELDIGIDNKGSIYILGTSDNGDAKNYLLHAYNDKGKALWHSIDISDFKEDIQHSIIDKPNSHLKIRDDIIYAVVKNILFIIDKEGRIKNKAKLQIEGDVHLIDFPNNNTVICITAKNAHINAVFNVGIYNNEGVLIKPNLFKLQEVQNDKEIYRLPLAISKNKLLIEEAICKYKKCDKKYIITEIEL